jgi:hypothetical protein
VKLAEAHGPKCGTRLTPDLETDTLASRSPLGATPEVRHALLSRRRVILGFVIASGIAFVVIALEAWEDISAAGFS